MPALGLKSQHVTSIEWLARATGADVSGLQVGSKTVEFRPTSGPGGLVQRNIKIAAESPAASVVLIFQAVFPFLLFASNEGGEPVELTISGGTNVSFSPSYEYLDQVLLPTLEAFFGVQVQRELRSRGWNSGGARGAGRGLVWFRIQPLPLNATLKLKPGLDLTRRPNGYEVDEVVFSLIMPPGMQSTMEIVLPKDLANLFQRATIDHYPSEDSGHESRIYVLVVATSGTKRWGRDLLYAGKRKGKKPEALCKEISRTVTRALEEDFRRGAVVDEHLQDQLVIFQALAEGRTSFRSDTGQTGEDETGDASADEIDRDLGKLHIGDELRKDRVRGPLGDPETDTSHTQTARWVASEMLEPSLMWYNNGTTCEGVSLRSGCGKPEA